MKIISENNNKKSLNNVNIGKEDKIYEFVNILSNSISKNKMSDESFKWSLGKLSIILQPFIPHISEEIWSNIDNSTLCINQSWPVEEVKKKTNLSAPHTVHCMGKDIIVSMLGDADGGSPGGYLHLDQNFEIVNVQPSSIELVSADGNINKNISYLVYCNYEFKIKTIKIFIHGFLHLLGHDHQKSKEYKQMLNEEKKIFKSIEKTSILN